jgi:hypothetical protein
MPWSDVIRNNFWMKVFSFVLAILIWAAVYAVLHGSNPFEIAKKQEFKGIPVRLMISPSNGSPFLVKPPRVTVVVSGTQEVLNKLRTNDVLVYARLLDFKSPVGEFFLETTLPREVTVDEIRPRRVTVETQPPLPKPPVTERPLPAATNRTTNANLNDELP